MCGVFGVINACLSLTPSDLKEFTEALLTSSETRGSEAAGVAVWWEHGVVVRKSQTAPKHFIQKDGFQEIFQDKAEEPVALVVGHARMVTNGSAIFDQNNQPVVDGNLTLVHNGIVTNYEYLDHSSGGDSDTVALVEYLSGRIAAGVDTPTAVSDLFGEINGSATVALLDTSTESLVIATNTGSLYAARLPDGRVAAFASERRILDSALNTSMGRKLPTMEVVGVPPGRAMSIERKTGATNMFDLKPYQVRNDSHFTGLTGVQSTMPPTRARVHLAPANLEPSLDKTRTFAQTVRRCVRCILPETIPFLEFDSDGMCSQCSTYTSPEIRTIDELETLLARSKSTEAPNCVVAFSGGRDSAYGLHLLVREYGMNPITLTYDWGMVTDLARRNQARMTGALGVEHVLISANIARKRSNIGKNLNAWIKNPALGMVPLLMAGDKQFFLHARRLARDTNLPLVIFCINPLETTFFKSGFAGIPDGKYYTSSTRTRKAQLFGYYASQFLRNPSYINLSLADTAQAAHATYLRPHDYLQLFEWVKWDEDEVNQLLVGEYGWETDPTTTTTWRIGDGTAPFYNYVYWRTMGFTENDTFRSNQVREGAITRERALQLAVDENEPRWQRIEEYLGLVDVHFDEAMTAIESLASRSAVG